MEHVSTAAMLRAMFDRQGWFSLMRSTVNSTALHLRTYTEPVCILVANGPTISVLVGKPSPDNEIHTFDDAEAVLGHLMSLAQQR